jgi:cytoskeletal protein CcmA (bactofilin family)
MSLLTKGSAPDPGHIETVIGPETYFQGVVTVRSSLKIEGEVEGDITEARGVYIAGTGRVKGDINAESVVIAGSVAGDVTATAQLELKSKGRIVGNIRTPKLLIEEGASFDGHCAMSGAPAQAETPEKVKKQAVIS